MSKRAFHVVYTVLALNFGIPVIGYAIDPETSRSMFVQLGVLFGGGEYPYSEDSMLWRVLAVANVATLAFCCVLLQVDLKRWYPVLTPLMFLKSSAAIGFLVAWLVTPFPSFLIAFLFDGVTVASMWFFATRAHRALEAA